MHNSGVKRQYILPTILFISIMLLATLLRLYKLDSVPPGVNRDEASIGYTAYSLLLTGKDEYGRFLPLSFQSFGDWKLPLYIYLTLPLVKILGLSEVSVRLISAVSGILTVFLTFFLVRLLFKNRTLAYLSMLVIAIAPWHVHLSRVESESNVAVLFTALGIYLFFKSFENKPKLIVLSFILWALTYFTYHGNHIFTTLLVIGIVALYRNTIRSSKYALTGLFIFILLAGSILSQTLIQADKTKISGISIFSSPFISYQQIEIPRMMYDNPNSFQARFFHNRIIFALETIGKSYVKSFSPEFLFISGGTNHAHNIKNFGNMYLIEFPFLLFGFSYLLTKLKDSKMKLLIWWILISPVAASITKDAPHTNRMFAIFPILPIVVASGIYWFMDLFKKQKLMFITAMIGILALYLLNFSVYMDRYYVFFPKQESENWGQGYSALTKVLISPGYKDKHVIMANPEQSPYIYLLFYSRYMPSDYQKQVVRYDPTEDGFYHVRRFDRYEFRPIDWSHDVNSRDTVLIDFLPNIPGKYINNVQRVNNFGLYTTK